MTKTLSHIYFPGANFVTPLGDEGKTRFPDILIYFIKGHRVEITAFVKTWVGEKSNRQIALWVKRGDTQTLACSLYREQF